MGLLKSMPPRATKQSDSAAISKASKTTQVSMAVKGGSKGSYNSMSTTIALVNSKLGHHADEYSLLRDEESVRNYFHMIALNGIGALDTETSGLDILTCILAGVCLYTPGQKPCYIPVNHTSYITGSRLSNQIDEAVIRECLEICNKVNVKWVMHNAKFDTRVVYHKIGIKIACYWDTQLAACCLNENESHKLKDLHFKYCITKDTEAVKFESLFEGIPFNTVPITTGYLYAAGDPIKTFELYEYQMKYLNRRYLPGPYYVFKEIEMPCIPVVASMEDTGICLDLEKTKYLSDKYHALEKEQQKTVFDILEQSASVIEDHRNKNPKCKLGNPINLNSPDQIAVLLYDIWGLKSPDKEKPRGTGEEILESYDNPFCKALLEYRGTMKLLSTYIDKMPNIINPGTGRIHCSFHQYGAVTGRFSSSDPNMQNIPSHNKEIRTMFSAAPGCVLISCDFSQQEPRTLAHMSQDPTLIQAYQDGKDIYAWIASSIYKMPYDECKEKRKDGTTSPEGKKRRDSVKSIILGIMYGRTAKSIGEQIGVSGKEAQKIIDSFYKEFPKVKQWTDKVISDAKKYGFVETAWGRKRRLPDVQLESYVFTWLEGREMPNFDPLNFDQVVVTEAELIPETTKAYFVKKLKDCYSGAKRAQIYEEAKAMGLKIKDNSRIIGDAERQCVNSIIQGSAADMTKLAMILIGNDEFLIERNCRLELQVHDEVIAECPEEYAKECADRLCELMVQAAGGKICVPMKVDAEVTHVWYGEEVA